MERMIATSIQVSLRTVYLYIQISNIIVGLSNLFVATIMNSNSGHGMSLRKVHEPWIDYAICISNYREIQ